MQLNAVRVRLSISLFPNTRADEGMTAEVQERHSLGSDSGKWVKTKLPEKYLAAVRKCAGAVRKWNNELTLPWEDGERLLTIKAQERYDREFFEHVGTFNQLVADFVASYPEALIEAQIMHNGTFEADDYPSVANVAPLFKMGVTYEPVPSAGHFVETLAGDALERMRGELEARNGQRVADAVADVWKRVLGPVLHLAEMLSSPVPCIREPLLGNIGEIVGLIPDLNLTGDRQLTAAAEAIKSMVAGLSTGALKESPVLRLETAQKALAIAQQFGVMGNRRFSL